MKIMHHSYDCRTCKIYSESKITIVVKELKKTPNQSRFIYSQSALITNDALKSRQNNFLCTNTVMCVNSVKHPGRELELTFGRYCSMSPWIWGAVMHWIASCEVCICLLYGCRSRSVCRSYPRQFSIDYDLKMQERHLRGLYF